MFLKSSWLPARVPFTITMLPLFWIVLLLSPNLNEWRSLWVLFIVHGLLYAATNGYVNSYTKKSSEGLDIDVGRTYLFLSFGFHVISMVAGFILINISFAILLLFYGLISHAYGIASVQWKAPSVPAWLVVRCSQGALAVLLYYVGLNDFDLGHVWNVKVWIPAMVSATVLAVFFPVQRHGYLSTSVTTLPALLLIFAASAITFWFFNLYISPRYNVGILFFFVISVVVLFLKSGVISNESMTKRRVLQDWVLAIILNGYAFYLFTDHTHVLQLIQP